MFYLFTEAELKVLGFLFLCATVYAAALYRTDPTIFKRLAQEYAQRFRAFFNRVQYAVQPGRRYIDNRNRIMQVAAAMGIRNEPSPVPGARGALVSLQHRVNLTDAVPLLKQLPIPDPHSVETLHLNVEALEGVVTRLHEKPLAPADLFDPAAFQAGYRLSVTKPESFAFFSLRARRALTAVYPCQIENGGLHISLAQAMCEAVSQEDLKQALYDRYQHVKPFLYHILEPGPPLLELMMMAAFDPSPDFRLKAVEHALTLFFDTQPSAGKTEADPRKRLNRFLHLSSRPGSPYSISLKKKKVSETDLYSKVLGQVLRANRKAVPQFSGNPFPAVKSVAKAPPKGTKRKRRAALEKSKNKTRQGADQANRKQTRCALDQTLVGMSSVEVFAIVGLIFPEFMGREDRVRFLNLRPDGLVPLILAWLPSLPEALQLPWASCLLFEQEHAENILQDYFKGRPDTVDHLVNLCLMEQDLALKRTLFRFFDRCEHIALQPLLSAHISRVQKEKSQEDKAAYAVLLGEFYGMVGLPQDLPRLEHLRECCLRTEVDRVVQNAVKSIFDRAGVQPDGLLSVVDVEGEQGAVSLAAESGGTLTMPDEPPVPAPVKTPGLEKHRGSTTT